MSAAINPSLPRLPALDGLRFFAVAGVMAWHFSPGTLGQIGPWGDWGVRVFFVLSGFLITGILLTSRTRIDTGCITFAREYSHFYLRRALRLWPAYLLAIAASLILSVAYAREMLVWNLTFTSNYYNTLEQTWPGLLSHLWTLGVEFQFYLLWPVLLLVAPRSALLPSLITLLVAGPAFRWLELYYIDATQTNALFLLLPANVDYFAWGALLALPASLSSIQSKIKHPALYAALCYTGCLVTFYTPTLQSYALWRALDCSLLGLGSYFLILHLIRPEPSRLSRVCSFAPFVYLGRISYGIYLYHNFSHRLSPGIMRRLTGESYLPNEFAHIGGLVIISILCGIVSWHIIEQPINRLRLQRTT